MSTQAFFVNAGKVALVANDNGARHLSQTDVHHLPPQVHLPMRTNTDCETVFYIEQGMVEFMVAGAAGYVGEGGMVRIPANVPFACRNVGDDIARLVSHRTRAGAERCGFRVTVDIAAA